MAEFHYPNGDLLVSAVWLAQHLSYCQGGGRAAHGVLALKLLGYGRVRNFDGSYGAYASSTAPVER